MRLKQKQPKTDLKSVTVKLDKVKCSVQKLNMIAHLIRKLPVPDALLQLRFSRKLHSAEFMQLINQGVKKAKEEINLEPSQMNVAIAMLGRGPYKKSLDIKGRGRMGVRRKPSANLTIVLREIPHQIPKEALIEVPTISPPEPSA